VGGGGTDGVKIIERAVDQSRVAFGSRDRRHEGVGPGRENQSVVGLTALAGDDFLVRAVDFKHLHAEVQVNTVGGVIVGVTHRQGFGIAATEVFGQVNPVIGALVFLAIDVDLILTQGAALDQLLDAVVADHTVADDDQCFAFDRGDVCVHELFLSRSRSRRGQQKSKKKPGADGSAPGAFAW